MDLDRYEHWLREECEYVLDLLMKDGLPRVLASCQSLGRKGVLDIASARREQVAEFFDRPPAQRTTLYRTLPEPERHAFLIVVLHKARCAYALLSALCRYGITDGIGRSMMMQQAGAAAIEVREGFPSLWPFSEHDPFDEGLEDF